MFKFTVELTFSSVFLFKVITWVPFMVEVEIWYASYPNLNLQLCLLLHLGLALEWGRGQNV